MKYQTHLDGTHLGGTHLRGAEDFHLKVSVNRSAV